MSRASLPFSASAIFRSVSGVASTMMKCAPASTFCTTSWISLAGSDSSITLELELLVHEAAGGVVVGDRQLGAGNAEVLRRQIEQRERQRVVTQLAREDDGDDDVIGVGRGGFRRVGGAGAGSSGGGCGR